MIIVATFNGDDTFTHIVDTSLLEPSVQSQVESAIKVSPFAEFFDDDFFSKIQEGVVAPAQFPLQIEAMIDVYL